jgi:hypothetical protein
MEEAARPQAELSGDLGVVVTVRNGLRRSEVIKVARGGEPFIASVADTLLLLIS